MPSHTPLRLSCPTLEARLDAARTLIQTHWRFDTAWLDGFMARLNEADLVTIDVFDTALTRSVETPADVFALMESILRQHHGDSFKNFACNREKAEHIARKIAHEQQNRQEISQAEIYRELERLIPQTVLTQSQLCQFELDCEKRVCFAVPELKKALEAARHAKCPVVFVSDMYLAAASIRQLLAWAHLPLDIPLLASSETLQTKADGTQWVYLKKQYPSCKNILHIGDNQHSDIASPLQHGIAVYPFQNARSATRTGGPLTPAILPFSIASRVNHPFAGGHATNRQNTMKQLGQSWGALVLGAYTKWLSTQIEKLPVQHVFFCARDGHLPYAAWNILERTQPALTPSSYLYLSRRALNFAAAATTCAPNYLSPTALETLSQTYKPNTVHTLLSRIGFEEGSPTMQNAIAYFGTLQTRIFWDTPQSVELFKKFLQRHTSSVYALLCTSLENALAYLLQEGLHKGPVAIVDVGWHGTMQSSIAQLLRHAGHKPQIYGLYCGLWNRAQRNRPKAGWMNGAFGNDFIPDTAQYALRNAVAILENLLTADHGTTLGYQAQNGKMVPILGTSTIESTQHARLIAPFQKATLEALHFIKTTGRHNTLTLADLSIENAQAALGRLALSPTLAEIQAIGAIEHCGDLSHAHYRPLVQTVYSSHTVDETPEAAASEWPLAAALAQLHACPTVGKAALRQHLLHQFAQCDSRTQAHFQ